MNPEAEYENQSLIKISIHGVRKAVALLFFLPVTAWAGGVVTNCTEAALRTAIGGGGAATFACDGTITLASTITNTLDTVFDGSGHQITISGSDACRVFFVNSNVNLTLVNLTIANGLSTNGYGGGIYNEGTLNAMNCHFVANTVQGAPGADLTMPASPGQDGSGGAVYNSGALNISGCSFAGNSACGGAGGGGQASYYSGTYVGGVGGAGNGGAICNLGLLAVSGSTFSTNFAFGGPGGVGGSGPPYGSRPYLVPVAARVARVMAALSLTVAPPAWSTVLLRSTQDPALRGGTAAVAAAQMDRT